MSWKITPIFYKGAKRLQVTFENIPTLNKKIRSIKGATFSATLQAWHVPDTAETRMQLNFYDESFAFGLLSKSDYKCYKAIFYHRTRH